MKKILLIIPFILYTTACSNNNNIYTEQWFNENCLYRTIHNIVENKNIINCQNVCSALIYHMRKNGEEIRCLEAFSWE